MSATSLGRFMADLRRRRVFRVAGGYVVIGWLIIEVSETTFPLINLPSWSPTFVLVLVLLGLPVAVMLAWAYDLTPDGVQRATSHSPAPAHLVDSGAATRDAEARRAASITTPDRWRQAQRILEAALELPPSERNAYIRRTAASDATLRDDIAALLAAHEGHGVLDTPALHWAMQPDDGTATGPPAEGRTIGHYEILQELGGGGMGVVYRARDRRLQRIVALKFLPPHLSDDADAKHRLLAEAQAAAALDHPHVCTLLEVGESGGHVFLAMPFYDGETLKRRLSRGPLPLADALDLAVQAANGLAAAHAKGIVHRDIKPGNLIITSDGVLKILDFGIAKLADVASTAAPLMIGTAAYMSPEHARGEPVDARTDVWSLGIVLYECLAGRRPFAGTDVASARERRDADPVSTWREGVPPAVEAVLRRALAHDPTDRYRNGAELRDALAALLRDQVFTGSSETQVIAAAPHALPPEGERRQATVVLSTLGGYARLVESAPPDVVASVIARIRVAAEELAARFGGRVNSFEDDRIELLFGVPVSHEDHCFRAIRAALELHERVRALEVDGFGGSRLLALHSGVDAGQVLAQPTADGTRLRLIGGPAQAAARLQAHAGPDELWITPACQRMVGPFFDSEPGPALALGGGAFDTPHRVLRLSGLRTRIEAGQRVGLTRYIGRESELSHLRDALAGAQSGRGQALVILGEAGVGKSRLLHELRAGAGAGVTFLEGRCQSYGTGTAYLPFIDVLRAAVAVHHRNADDAATVVSAIRSIGGELDELIPLYLHLLSLTHGAHVLPPHLTGEALRHAMQEAIAGLITLMTRAGPVVLLLEDWHWADDASREVLKQIFELGPEHRLLVIVTSRPNAAEARELARLTVLPIEPLGTEASADMLRTVLGVTELSPDLAERVHARTGGNPFFIEEVARTLLEEGAVSVRDGVAIVAGDPRALHLPDTVEAVIRARLDRLDSDTREVARLASAVGREFERRLLEQAMRGGSRLPHALQTLKSAGLVQQIRVVPDAAYRFNHALTQEVAYASLLERQRVAVHARVADAIERVYAHRLEDHYDRLAEHFSRAGSWGRAVHYGLRAADRLAGLSAFPDALEQLERCEEWTQRIDRDDDDHTLVDVLLRQERLCETLGLRARQQQLIDRVLGLLDGSDDRRLIAEAHLRQGDLFTLLRRFTDAERVLFESLRLRREMSDSEGIRNSLRSLGLLRWHEDRPAEAIVYIQEALQIDRERDDMDALIGDLSNLGAVQKSMGELARARATLEEALRLFDAESTGARANLLKECYILHNLANVHRELGDLAAAVGYLERVGRVTERARLPIQLSYHFTSLAHMCLQQGRVDESLDYYRRAVEMARRARYSPGLSQALRMMGEVLLGLGRATEALPCLAEAAELFAQLEDRDAELGLRRAIARIHERGGSAMQTLSSWRRVVALYTPDEDDAVLLEARVGIALASRRAGIPLDQVRAAQLEALDHAIRAGARSVQGRLLNSLGILAWEGADYEQALEYFRAALTIYRALGDDAALGLMLNSVGVTLKALDRRDEARAALEEALIVHRRAGNPLLAGHAYATLGDIALESGAADRALWLFTESHALREEAGDRLGGGWMQRKIASAHVALGSPVRALPHIVAARAVANELGDSELLLACEQAMPAATNTNPETPCPDSSSSATSAV